MIRPSGCFSARCRLSSAPLSPAVDQRDPAAGNPALGPECLSLQATNLISSQALIYSQQRLSLMISDHRKCHSTTPTNKNKIYSILHFNHFHKCWVLFQKWMSDFLSWSLFHSAISSAGLGWDSSRIPDVTLLSYTYEFILRDPEAFPGCSQARSTSSGSLPAGLQWKWLLSLQRAVTLLAPHNTKTPASAPLFCHYRIPQPREISPPAPRRPQSTFTKLAPSPNTFNWNMFKLVGKQQHGPFSGKVNV